MKHYQKHRILTWLTYAAVIVVLSQRLSAASAAASVWISCSSGLFQDDFFLTLDGDDVQLRKGQETVMLRPSEAQIKSLANSVKQFLKTPPPCLTYHPSVKGGSSCWLFVSGHGVESLACFRNSAPLNAEACQLVAGFTSILSNPADPTWNAGKLRLIRSAFERLSHESSKRGCNAEKLMEHFRTVPNGTRKSILEFALCADESSASAAIRIDLLYMLATAYSTPYADEIYTTAAMIPGLPSDVSANVYWIATRYGCLKAAEQFANQTVELRPAPSAQQLFEMFDAESVKLIRTKIEPSPLTLNWIYNHRNIFLYDHLLQKYRPRH